LPIERGVHRQHHFVYAARRNARDQAFDIQIFGPHAIKRRKLAAKDMILAGKEPGSVKRPQIRYIFDHTKRTRIAARKDLRCRYYRMSRMSSAAYQRFQAREAAAASHFRASSSDAAPRAAPSAGRGREVWTMRQPMRLFLAMPCVGY